MEKITPPDLVNRLRALANYQHDDLSIAEEAAEEIERLRERIRLFESYIGCPCFSEQENRAR
ncbi:hypothetical protein [Acidithiobacillus thiooxidans]|uniref:Uncharacterized protein n=1 Tax=Acidithiobacillus thiooxidans TaxID=930 RepID=A0A1C2I938_ACITH|nr:hypothetical protein [Acidithiobacillus thiooxidans]OCX72506.1 hypothetical protein A6M23_09700 [Acidithiobacillus thiooxidans]OCX85685.1 hypothetical protein A6P08_07460 [Acidithiobacillus thiooxidans]